MKKRVLSLFLTLVMLLGMLPVSTMAAGSNQNYELKVLDFEGEYWDALIDDSQYGGQLLYGDGMGFASEEEAYSWADETTKLSHVLPYNYYTYCYMGGGHAISNYASADYTTYGDYLNQLTVYDPDAEGLARSGGGHNGSDNFVVHYGYMDGSAYNMTENLPALTFSDGEARVVDHMYVNITNYTINCLINGNDLTQPGGEFWVKAIGYNGEEKTGELQITLSDGETAMTTDWTKWDLSSLGAVTSIQFNVGGGADNGYGFSQPSYFAYDDVAVRFPKEATPAPKPDMWIPSTNETVYENDDSIESSFEVYGLYDGDGNCLTGSKVTWTLQTANAADGDFTDTAITGVAEMVDYGFAEISWTIPAYSEVGEKYFRFKLVGDADGYASSEPAYSDVITVTYQAGGRPAAPKPELNNSDVVGSVSIYQNDDLSPTYSVKVKKLGDGLTNPKIKWTLQVADSENGPWSDTVKTGMSPAKNNATVKYQHPAYTEAGTKYYRLKLVGIADGLLESEALYTGVTTAAYAAGSRTAFIVAAPVQNDTGINVKLQSGSDMSLPYTDFHYPDYDTTDKIIVKGWDQDKYDFTGWTLTGPGESVIQVDKTGFSINSRNDASILETWADYVQSNDTNTGFAISTSKNNSGTEFYLEYTLADLNLLKDIVVTPEFTSKGATAYKPTLVQTDGGTITRVRDTGETHVLTAAAKEHHVFSRWEQSTDGGNTWSEIDGAEAVATVTLTTDTSYRAIFTALAFDGLFVKNYALPSVGEKWVLNLAANMNIVPPSSSAGVTVNVYEGTSAEGTLLGTATVNVFKDAKNPVSLRVNLDKRPGSGTANIFVTAALPTGKTASAAYTLKGTLDIIPAELTVDTTKALFLGAAPTSYQLSVAGDPAPDPDKVTYSGYVGTAGATSNYASVDETGVVTFTRFYGTNNPLFVADAGDGRIAECKGTFLSGNNAMKLSDNVVHVEAGKELTLSLERSSTAAHMYRTGTSNHTKTTVTSSNESVFTATFTTKAQGTMQDIVDQLVITGVAPGTATLTITVGVGDTAAVWTGTVIVPDPEAVVTGVAVAPETAELQTGETLKLATEVEPYGASHTLWFDSSDTAVARVNDSGLVTGVSAGTAMITVSAKDGQGNTVTDTCTVTVLDDPYQVNVYVPKGTVDSNALKFYTTTGFDANNHDTFDIDAALSFTVDSTTSAEYDIYKLPLQAGTYSFRAEGLGGGCFAIPAEKQGGGYEDRSNTPIYLRKVETYILNTVGETKADADDFSVEMSNKLGTVTMGEAYVNADGYGCYPALVYANGNALLYYTNFIPSAAYAVTNSVGSVTHQNYALDRGTAVDSIKMTLPTTSEFIINAPADAEVAVFNQIKNFNTVRIDPVAARPQNDGTVDFVFNITKSTNMSYRVSMEGKRTQSGFFTAGFGGAATVQDRIVIDFGTASPTEQDHSGRYEGESSLLLNINERNKLNLAVGEKYKVRAYRAAWQIINNISANIMLEPDFHYTVLSGDDVIGIETVSGGNAKDNWAWITAKKEGVAIVEVSYDAIDVADGKINGRDREFYGASDPNRTGVFIVTVGSQYGDIGGINLDAEYNEVYFVGDQGALTISPKGSDVTVSVASVWEGHISGWTQVTGENGVFNVPVQSGNNVLKITSNGTTDYRVVRASKVTPVITNKTNAERTDVVYPGDEIEIGFEGIYIPMPKFSGIYNPGYPSNMGISYKLGEANISSPTTQYGLIELKVPVTVPADAAGSILLTGGKIFGDALGSNWGEHRTLTDSGIGANFNASGVVLDSLPLPDLTIRVARLSDDAAKQDAKDTITAAFASYDESKYSSENWAKIIAIKDKALADIDTAETLFDITNVKNTALTEMAKVEKISSGNVGGNTGTDKTHTNSYYPTTGLNFGLSSGEIEGYVTISFEDYGERLNDADFETPLGVLIKPTKVPFKQGESIAHVSLRLLEALEIGYEHTGSLENNFYLSKIKNFKLSDGTEVEEFGEFDSGAASGWMITCNNWFVNRSTADFEVEDGDYIKWQNTCQLGADIGCDWSNQSAEITGFRFQRNYGTLSPRFSSSTTDYIYTIPSSVTSICVEATLENYWAILTCTSGGVEYKPMQAIPVENGTVIEFTSSFAEYAGDVPTDLDYRTITIQVKGEAPVTPGAKPTVPISGEQNSIDVTVTVDGAKATISEVDMSDLNTVVGDKVSTGTVTIDFSGLKSNKTISTVEIPADTVKKIAEAVNDPKNDAHSLKIVLSDGASIEFDAAALKEKASQANGADITISIESHENVKLTNAQKKALGDRPAFDINVTSGGKHISDMGGKITVHAPYVLKGNEKARGIVVWYVDDNGNKERCVTSYDPIKQRVNWKTDHLSLYMIDYDETLANNPFADVTEDTYYFDAVLWAIDEGITSGTSATTFSPNASCTRAQMVTFLWRAAGSPKATVTSCAFTDVDKDAYYYEALLWAVENGITSGTSATTFSPDASCTRGQMAMFLYRSAKTPTVSSDSSFSDVSDTAYYKDAVNWAKAEGITAGTSATTFSPDAVCTRGQMVTFLYRYLTE